MTQKISIEPFSLWKDLYEQTEKAWHDVIQNTLGKESFSEGLGQIQNSYLQYHEMISNLTETYLKQANIPTPDEIANVASLVINLEEKVDTIDDQILEHTNTSTQQITELKQSISALESKFDQILDAISALDKKVTTASSVKTTTPRKKATPRNTPAKDKNTDTIQ